MVKGIGFRAKRLWVVSIGCRAKVMGGDCTDLSHLCGFGTSVRATSSILLVSSSNPISCELFVNRNSLK